MSVGILLLFFFFSNEIELYPNCAAELRAVNINPLFEHSHYGQLEELHFW